MEKKRHLYSRVVLLTTHSRMWSNIRILHTPATSVSMREGSAYDHDIDHISLSCDHEHERSVSLHTWDPQVTWSSQAISQTLPTISRLSPLHEYNLISSQVHWSRVRHGWTSCNSTTRSTVWMASISTGSSTGQHIVIPWQECRILSHRSGWYTITQYGSVATLPTRTSSTSRQRTTLTRTIARERTYSPQDTQSPLSGSISNHSTCSLGTLSTYSPHRLQCDHHSSTRASHSKQLRGAPTISSWYL